MFDGNIIVNVLKLPSWHKSSLLAERKSALGRAKYGRPQAYWDYVPGGLFLIFIIFLHKQYWSKRVANLHTSKRRFYTYDQ